MYPKLGRDNRFEDIDKKMADRIEAIYGDPKRHAFESEYDILKNEVGPRGGKVRGRKTYCYHCGGRPWEHAEETEDL